MRIKITHGRLKPKKEASFSKVKKPFKGKNKNRKGLKIITNRIKPKYKAKNDNHLNLGDLSFLKYLITLDVVCFSCGQKNGIEWHHVKEYSSDKKDHTRLIPLCGVECHRLGTVLSPHGTPKKWRETFSMEVQLKYAKNFYSEYLAQKIE